MKNIIVLLCCLLLTACSGTCAEPREPVVDAGSDAADVTTVPTAAPAPVNSIEWKTPTEMAQITSAHPEVCLFVFIEDPEKQDRTKQYYEEFKDEALIKSVNELFFSMRMDLTTDQKRDLMQEMGLKELPSIVLSPGLDAESVFIGGFIRATELHNLLGILSDKGEILEKCAGAKSAAN